MTNPKTTLEQQSDDIWGAPDTIWATFDIDVSAQTTDVYAQDVPEGFVDKPVKYIRADIATATLLRALADPSDEMLDAASKAFEVALMSAPDQSDDQSDEAWCIEIGRLGVRAAISALLTGAATNDNA